MADTSSTQTSTLPTSTASGSQASTQNPQSAGQQPLSSNSAGSDVQPSGTDSVLNSDGGIPLIQTTGESVGLASSSTSTAPTTALPAHHPDLALFGFSGVLLLMAIYLFWSTAHSAKNTTE
jgi:hypothetical protein